MFHVTGGAASDATPDPCGPRNDGQSCACTPTASMATSVPRRRMTGADMSGWSGAFDRHAGDATGRQFLVDHQQADTAVAGEPDAPEHGARRRFLFHLLSDKPLEHYRRRAVLGLLRDGVEIVD